MMRLRFSLTLFQLLQLHCATVLLWTAPRWHGQDCSPGLNALPLWALMGFAMWRMASGFRLAPRKTVDHGASTGTMQHPPVSGTVAAAS